MRCSPCRCPPGRAWALAGFCAPADIAARSSLQNEGGAHKRRIWNRGRCHGVSGGRSASCPHSRERNWSANREGCPSESSPKRQDNAGFGTTAHRSTPPLGTRSRRDAFVASPQSGPACHRVAREILSPPSPLQSIARPRRLRPRNANTATGCAAAYIFNLHVAARRVDQKSAEGRTRTADLRVMNPAL